MAGIDALVAHPLAAAIGWSILQSVWQVTLVALVVAVTLVLAKRCTADVRYAICAAGLTAMIGWPVATVIDTRAELVHPALEPSASSSSVSSIAGDGGMLSPASMLQAPGPRLRGFAYQLWLPYASLVWAAGVALLGLRTLGGWFVVQRLRRRAVGTPPQHWRVRFATLARRLRIESSVELLESAVVEVPTVIGWIKPVVLVPAAAFAGLAPRQLEAILAHELAHVRRHDYLANLLQSCVEALLFYHPAVWWLSGRARAEREHCCDDVAVAACGDPVGYARALADLEQLRRLSPMLAVGADGGPLLRRVARVLGSPEPHHAKAPSWIAATAALAFAIALVPGALDAQNTGGQSTQVQSNTPPEPPDPPGPPPPPPPPGPQGVPAAPSTPAPPAPPDPSRMSQAGDEGRITRSSPTENWEVRYKGVLELTPDDRDVLRLAPGGYVKAREGGWFSTRSVEAQADATGRISRKYFVGRRETAYEPEGRELLAGLLQKMVAGGVAAVPRVTSLLRRGGPGAVLAAIDSLTSDYARRVYYTELFKQATPDAATLGRALGNAARQIASDYELAEVLAAAAPQAMADAIPRQAFVQAARSIGSDYELRRALKAALATPSLAPAARADLLQAAEGVGSDYEAAELLGPVARAGAMDEATRAAFFRAVGTIDSDYEHARVLTAVIEERSVDTATLLDVLRSARSMNGRHELSQLLQRIARQHAVTGEVRVAYLAAADTLGNGFEKDQAYAALVHAERRTK